MKSLHFVKALIPLILDGSKTITWRLWDDKDLAGNDIVRFLEAGSNKHFATAKITQVIEKQMGQLSDNEKDGHEKFENDKQMYETYTKYYGKKVGPKTLVKVVWFKLI